MFGILNLDPVTSSSTLRRADLGWEEQLMTTDLLPTVVSTAGITAAFLKFNSMPGVASGSGINVNGYAAPASGYATEVIHIR